MHPDDLEDYVPNWAYPYHQRRLSNALVRISKWYDWGYQITKRYATCIILGPWSAEHLHERLRQRKVCWRKFLRRKRTGQRKRGQRRRPTGFERIEQARRKRLAAWMTDVCRALDAVPPPERTTDLT